MKFIKMHGAGNDYVYIDLFKENVKNPSELAVQMSHRHFGIGGDGLILIKPNDQYDAEMIMYNSDGSLSEMCGNGLRCVAKYVFDHHLKGQKELNLQTGAGPKKATIDSNSDGLAESVTIDMGPPILESGKIPLKMSNLNETEICINQSIAIEDKNFQFTSVSMGNPHCIIYIDDVKNFPVEKYGPKIENHSIFPNRVNVEFVEIVNQNSVIQRTWERGSGETWACGTGAAAVCVAGHLNNKTKSPLNIKLLGGELKLEWDGKNSVFMTGPAVEVFQGEWNA